MPWVLFVAWSAQVTWKAHWQLGLEPIFDGFADSSDFPQIIVGPTYCPNVSFAEKRVWKFFAHLWGLRKKNNKIVVCLFFLLRRKVRNLWLQDFFWITLAPTTLQSCTEVAVYLGFCVAKTCLQIWNAIFAGFFLQLVEIHKGDNRQSEHKHLRVKKALDCVALWGISSSFQLTESVRPQVSWQTYKL